MTDTNHTESTTQRRAIAVSVRLDDAPSEPMWMVQYPLSMLFLLTLAVAVGLSGGNWMSPKVFAGTLAVIANVVVFGYELCEFDDPRLHAIVVSVCVACAVAIGVALV